MHLPVIVIGSRDVGDKRVRGVGLVEERGDREEHLGDGQRGAPLVLQDVQADRAVLVDVAVVDLRRELALRRLERVIGGEVNLQVKDASLIRCIRRASDHGVPVEKVLNIKGSSIILLTLGLSGPADTPSTGFF